MWSAKTNKNEFSRSSFVFSNSRYLTDYMKKLLSIVQHQMREPFGRVSFIRASTSVPTLILSFTNPNPQNGLSIRRLQNSFFLFSASSWRVLFELSLSLFSNFSILSLQNLFAFRHFPLFCWLYLLLVCINDKWHLASVANCFIVAVDGFINGQMCSFSSSDPQLNEYYARLSMQTPFFMSPSHCFVCSKFGAIKFREVHASLNNISSPFSFYSSQF